jgi:hypothetical protein
MKVIAQIHDSQAISTKMKYGKQEVLLGNSRTISTW